MDKKVAAIHRLPLLTKFGSNNKFGEWSGNIFMITYLYNEFDYVGLHLVNPVIYSLKIKKNETEGTNFISLQINSLILSMEAELVVDDEVDILYFNFFWVISDPFITIY